MIRLRELREERDWSMRDAAKYLGKSYTTYVNHEKEYREPNSEDLAGYAKAYGVSVDYLIGRTDVRTTLTNEDQLKAEELELAKSLQILRDKPETRAMLDIYAGLDASKARIMQKFIESLKDDEDAFTD